ncbi:MAG: 2Fe-2S iron-sulfur cluster-binding protein [Campylobacterota bacterium]|nr:2Fe-2S iron-sulfur cluster-binding protein [Campylobacterota bacterium]
MSERIIHRGKELLITIDGKQCEGIYGQTILEIARANDIYIPTMCYLTKVSPIASCRMCVVDVEGVEGHVLSCQEKAVNGAVITTNNDELFRHRQNTMKAYDVNHPLQCGVCDKSGECDLQNKTLEFKVDSQEFTTKDQKRKDKKWGVLSYDPSLCIMCEKCVHTCNEVIGSTALYIKPGGYNSTIDIKMSRCEQCGDCISVCPVGALVSTDYKYSSNAWESQQVPSSCAHCSSGCALYYDVKTVRKDNVYSTKIMRVKNDFEFASLCGAGRFGFNFENINTGKDENALNAAVEAIINADAIKFNSYISNEEAQILQSLKEQLGIKLVNEDAYNYQQFINGYTAVTGTHLYSGDLNDVEQSDYVIMLGSRISRDNPGVKYHLNMATKKQRAEFIYMHPIDDEQLKNKYTQFVKYEVGSEESVVALMAKYLIQNGNDELKAYFDEMDLGYLSAETNVGEEELELMVKKLLRRKNKTLVVGTDLFGHKKANNIGKLVGLIEQFSDFKVVIAPSQTNTLGVSLICDLDAQTSGKTVGYNEKADFMMSNHEAADLNLPALNQQEGTFVSINKHVVNSNVALDFDGYCLNDVANKILTSTKVNTIDYTASLPVSKGFKAIEFDALDSGYTNAGVDKRGYYLDTCTSESNQSTSILEELDEIKAYDGSVIYRCEPLHQFNKSTAQSEWLKADSHLRGSASFAKAAKIAAGDKVNIIYNDKITTKMFKIDTTIKGTVALYPTFDDGLSDDAIPSGYRYKQVKIEKVKSDE